MPEQADPELPEMLYNQLMQHLRQGVRVIISHDSDGHFVMRCGRGIVTLDFDSRSFTITCSDTGSPYFDGSELPARLTVQFGPGSSVMTEDMLRLLCTPTQGEIAFVPPTIRYHEDTWQLIPTPWWSPPETAEVAAITIPPGRGHRLQSGGTGNGIEFTAGRDEMRGLVAQNGTIDFTDESGGITRTNFADAARIIGADPGQDMGTRVQVISTPNSREGNPIQRAFENEAHGNPFNFQLTPGVTEDTRYQQPSDLALAAWSYGVQVERNADGVEIPRSVRGMALVPLIDREPPECIVNSYDIYLGDAAREEMPFQQQRRQHVRVLQEHLLTAEILPLMSSIVANGFDEIMRCLFFSLAEAAATGTVCQSSLTTGQGASHVYSSTTVCTSPQSDVAISYNERNGLLRLQFGHLNENNAFPRYNIHLRDYPVPLCLRMMLTRSISDSRLPRVVLPPTEISDQPLLVLPSLEVGTTMNRRRVLMPNLDTE